MDKQIPAELNLTQGQQDAFNKMLLFIEDDDAKVFIRGKAW